MKENKGRIIAIGICVTVMLIGVATLVLILGGFGERLVSGFRHEEVTGEVETTEPLEQFVAAKPVGRMDGVWLDYGVDCKEDEKVNEAMAQIAQWKFNTVVLRGCGIENLDRFVLMAKDNGLYTVYSCSVSDFISGGVVIDSAVQGVADSGVDSVMVSMGDITEREISGVVQALHRANNSLYVGVQAAAQVEYSPVCSSEVFDYKYIDITVPTSKIDGEYGRFLNSYFDGTTPETVFGIHTELLGNSEGYEKPEEIMAQLNAVANSSGNGCLFYRYALLKENRQGLTDAIVDFRGSGVMQDYFKTLNISKPEKTDIKTQESHISFVGTGDIKQPLTINGEAVQMVDDGYFSVEKTLKPGQNIFTFSHKGKTLVYTVTYDMKLISSVKPTGTVNAPGGTEIEVVVCAHKSAKVTATIAGSSVSLVRSDNFEDTAGSGNSDYTYFVGKYTLPKSGEKANNLGSIKVTAAYSGLSESATGAKVVVNAQEKPYVPPETQTQTQTTTQKPTQSVTDSSSVSSEEDSAIDGTTSATATEQPTTKPPKVELFKTLTPYEYNGVSGKSKMIVVSEKYGETLPSTTANDVSVPYFVALPEGTVDYVVGTSSYENIKYYILASGRRVYRDEVKYIESGYNMPANEIKTVGVTKNGNSTNITFTMKWRVPFDIREKPQSFFEQTAGRPYSITSFTANYVDIKFYYTTAVDAAPQFNSSVVKRAEWISDSSAGTQTLRLHLNKQGGFYGIRYFYNSDGTLTFSVKERTSSAVAGKVIMLDAGHGGRDPGAIGTAIVGSKNIYEETVNLAIASKVKSKLEALGATVIMTRTSSGQTLELDERRDICRSKNPDIFIAVHCDASATSASASGTTAYYYKCYSQPLAKSLNKHIVSAYKTKVYKNDSAMAAKVDKGALFKPFRVTRVEECPAVLIEYGFMTNVKECAALAKDTNQEALAQGTVDGIVDYFKNS